MTTPGPEGASFRHVERLRVRWAEVDAQQIVFNGHYLAYVDVAVAGYWRALAAPYAETMRRLGGDLYVRKATLEYLASARYDDLLDIGIRCARVGRSSLAYEARIARRGQVLVTGELVYVFADPASQTSRPVPDALRAALAAFEAGEAMVEVRLGAWADLRDEAQPLRMRVFVEEQRVPLDLELDPDDDTHRHAIAVNRFDQTIATGRLMRGAPGIARIGRMAVDATMRQGGVGRLILDRLIEEAVSRGDREVRLHAQIAACAFYRRAGFVEEGEHFDDAGIEHVEMVRRL